MRRSDARGGFYRGEPQNFFKTYPGLPLRYRDLENAHTGFALLPYKLPRPPHKPYLYA